MAELIVLALWLAGSALYEAVIREECPPTQPTRAVADMVFWPDVRLNARRGSVYALEDVTQDRLPDQALAK